MSSASQNAPTGGFAVNTDASVRFHIRDATGAEHTLELRRHSLGNVTAAVGGFCDQNWGTTGTRECTDAVMAHLSATGYVNQTSGDEDSPTASD